MLIRHKYKAVKGAGAMASNPLARKNFIPGAHYAIGVFALLIALSLQLAWIAPNGGAAAAQQFDPPFIEGPGSTLSQAPRPAVPHSPKLPYGLQLMAKFGLLPTLRDTRCVQDSSYDRTGGNGDCGHFFRMEGDRAVLADIRGPGCIYRL